MHLPNEILSLVLAYVTEHDLSVCTRVSKAFEKVAVRLLYRDVYFNRAGRIVQGREAVLTPIAQVTPSRVSSPESFMRTLQDVPSYRLLVKSVTLALLEGPRLDAIRPIIDILEQLAARSAQDMPFVHVGCPAYSYWFVLAERIPLRSIKLKVDHNTEAPPEFYHLLREVMALQSVEHITLAGLAWPGYDSFEDPMADVVLGQPPRFSEVKTMSIMESGLPDDSLEKFLAWPKALQAFAYELSDVNRYKRTYPEGTIERALLMQAKTLEQINIETAGVCYLRERLVTSFEEFARLKRLSVPFKFMGEIRTPPRDRFGKAYIEPPLHTNLPPSLESLRIEVPVYEMRLRFSERTLRDIDVFSVNERGTAFTNWLGQFAKDAKENCARLRRLSVWWKADTTRELQLTSSTPPALEPATIDFVPVLPG